MLQKELTNDEKLRIAIDILMDLRKRMEDNKAALRMVKAYGKPEDIAQVEIDLANSTKAYNDAMAIFVRK